MRWARRLLGWGLAAVGAAAGVLYVQAQQARRNGEFLGDGYPLDLEIKVGGTGPPVRIVWLGDSTAAGVGASDADGSVARRVARGLDQSVLLTVLGVSGARIGDVLRNQVGHVPPDTDLVVITVGANDVTHLTDRRSFRRDYLAVLDALPATASVVVLGTPDFGTTPRLAQPLRASAGWRSDLFDATVKAIATRRGIPVVDIHGDDRDEFHQNPSAFFATDGFHPDDNGYRLWAEATLPVVQEALRERDRSRIRPEAHGHATASEEPVP